jgi:hypothetical protein
MILMVLGQTLFVLQVPMDIRELMVLILNFYMLELKLVQLQQNLLNLLVVMVVIHMMELQELGMMKIGALVNQLVWQQLMEILHGQIIQEEYQMK